MKNILTLTSTITLSTFLLLSVLNGSVAQNNPDTAETKSSITANNYYLDTAKTYLELKDYARAIDALELATILEPGNTEAQKLLKESRQLLEKANKSNGIESKIAPHEESKITPSKNQPLLLENAQMALKE